MKNLNYEELRKIETSATSKLLIYMEENVDKEKVLEKMDFLYPYFQDDSNRLAVDLWLSMDYTPDNGEKYIDAFLLDNKTSLTNVEKQILVNRIDSYVSLFEIIDYQEDHIIVKDLLQNEIKHIWEPILPKVISEGEIILGRVGKLIDEYSFIGNMNYLPITVKPMFIEGIFIDLNLSRRIDSTLTIKSYLKQNTLTLYRIYGDCILDAIENNEDVISILYDELDEFELYLQGKNHNVVIGKHISNLIDFFEYYLIDEDLTLYDLDQLDFEVFFNQAMDEGFIASQDSLNSYISTIKKYLLFLSTIYTEYKDSYLQLLEISKNRFSFMSGLHATNTHFKFDNHLTSILTLLLNESALTLLGDYDRFLLYTVEKPLELTEKNKYIQRNHLLDFDNILDKENITTKKNPNQEDFPLIHLFYYLSLHLDLLSINNSYMTITKKGTQYLRLSDEEKYSLFFNYLWSKDFTKSVINKSNINSIEISKKNFVGLIQDVKENKYYGMTSIAEIYSGNSSFFFSYYKFMEYLGLMSCKLYPNYEIMITTLGKTIFNYLIDKENKVIDSSIIDLETFKRSK